MPTTGKSSRFFARVPFAGWVARRFRGPFFPRGLASEVSFAPAFSVGAGAPFVPEGRALPLRLLLAGLGLRFLGGATNDSDVNRGRVFPRHG